MIDTRQECYQQLDAVMTLKRQRTTSPGRSDFFVRKSSHKFITQKCKARFRAQFGCID